VASAIERWAASSGAAVPPLGAPSRERKVSLDRIGTRIALAALAVALVTLGIVTVGVMQVGSDAFAGLMVAAGVSAEHARTMFEQSVAVVIGLGVVVAAVVALVLAWLFARRIARPIERLAETAMRTAEGDLRSMAPEEGPAEIRDLARAYNLMVDRLAEQDAIRREFVVNAAHELRTPLTNLQGYLEALADGVLPPEPATFESLREEVDRLTRLAASLDALGGGDERPVPQDVDLGAAARAAVELAAPGFRARGIAVTVDAPSGCVAPGRTDEIAQVLANYLQNALRYTPPGGRVDVAVARREEDVVVRVANSGSAIPAADLPRVWERFYRVEKSRDRATGGAGIGLAIVKRLVEEMGGRVGVTSGANLTTFWFSLPARSGV
jgi:two-component system, OmpR family, sensor histidine kinase BaeS